MKNVFALIDLHASPELGVLTEKRPVASTTVDMLLLISL